MDPKGCCSAVAFLIASMACTPVLFGEVRPHAMISDGMVLQRERDVAIWGTARRGEKIVVVFRGHEVTTTAVDGTWSVRMPSGLPGGPFSLSIVGENTITLKNVLVGEVWLCSGQSNMGWPLGPRPGDPARQGTEYPQVRLLNVPAQKRDQPQSDLLNVHWDECGPETVGNFSAVAYYFGRDLHKSLSVPIGLIHASYGGSPIEQWVKLDSASNQEPATGLRPGKAITPGLYNGMIAPLVPFTIRGVIWYQGEANADAASTYEELFSSMIGSWRKDWEQSDLPFLFVQVAPYGPLLREPQESKWAELREAQRQVSLKVPGTGMAVITDFGHETDIHPKPKEPVGDRLVRLARRLVYKQDVVASGPTFDSMKIDGRAVVLSIRDMHGSLDGGLRASAMDLQNVTRDPRTGKTGGSLRVVETKDRHTPLVGFTIAGADGRYVLANAEIRGDTVVLSAREIEKPVAVRYGWADYPSGNLFNTAGLPASPFQVKIPNTPSR